MFFFECRFNFCQLLVESCVATDSLREIPGCALTLV